MTNFEKYKKDIKNSEYRFGYNVKTNEISACSLMHCSDCKFCFGCRLKQIEWLYEEYNSILTDAEINLINTLSKITGVTYNFIVRDKFNEIKLYHNIPITKVNKYDKRYLSQKDYMNISDRTKKLFPNIQYKDGIYDITKKRFIEERERIIK